LIVLGVNIISSFLIGFSLIKNKFESIPLNYDTSDYIQFNLVYAMVASVFFIVFTYMAKWWYGNAKGTPKLFFGKF
jgi:hypothetical protein